jgi:hypothetical protein
VQRACYLSVVIRSFDSIILVGLQEPQFWKPDQTPITRNVQWFSNEIACPAGCVYKQREFCSIQWATRQHHLEGWG